MDRRKVTRPLEIPRHRRPASLIEVKRSLPKVSPDTADRIGMNNMLLLATLAAAGGALTLYIMRRRVRLGRRTPKF
jgi:hypothetical protein